MNIELSDTAGNVMLDALSELMDGGSIELLADTSRVLAVLKLSNPATKEAVGGEIVFNTITEEDSAPAQGNVMSARIVAANGSEILSCDVSAEDGDGVIKLNTTRIFRGGPVRLKSFRLVMP